MRRPYLRAVSVAGDDLPRQRVGGQQRRVLRPALANGALVDVALVGDLSGVQDGRLSQDGDPVDPA
jgi:hypothetical protein